ncbi:MAG: HEAT repeat domain-containing protein, partial [Planctomycetota bacterium]
MEEKDTQHREKMLKVIKIAMVFVFAYIFIIIIIHQFSNLTPTQQENKSVEEQPKIQKPPEETVVKPENTFEKYIKDLNDTNLKVREEAARELGKLKNPESIQYLINALGDRTAPVRQAAYQALCSIGKPALDMLINTLNDTNQIVRKGAIDYLGEMRDKKAVDPLIEILNDANLDIRRAAAKALIKLGDTRGIKIILEAVNSQNVYARSDAVEALGETRVREYIPLIVESLNDK